MPEVIAAGFIILIVGVWALYAVVEQRRRVRRAEAYARRIRAGRE